MIEDILNYGALFGGLAFLTWVMLHLLYDAIQETLRDRRRKREEEGR